MNDILHFGLAPNVSAFSLIIHESFEAFVDQAVNGSPPKTKEGNEEFGYFLPLHQQALMLQAHANGYSEAQNIMVPVTESRNNGATTDEYWFLTGKMRDDGSGVIDWQLTVFQMNGKDPDKSAPMKVYDSGVTVTKDKIGRINTVNWTR